MTFVKCAVAMAGAGLLAALPCAAAADPAPWNERQVSAFAGLNVRMSLGGAKPARPTARLQLTTSYDVRDARVGGVETFKPQGLELGAARNGAPILYVNGRTTAETQEKLRLSGSNNTVLIVFGVALVAVAVLVLVTTEEAALPGPII